MSSRLFRPWGWWCALGLAIHLAPRMHAQPEPPAAPLTNDVFAIDLPAALRLASSQNLDIQIARQILAEAKANRDSSIEQFFPWVTPGLQFRRRDGLAQSVPSGIVSEGHFQSYAPGATVVAQLSIGEAIYNSLAARQNLRAAQEALETQRQDSALVAAQRYFELVKAKALVEVSRAALETSQLYQQQLHDAVAAGIAFRGEELRVQTQTERYQIALRQSLERVRIASASLAQTLRIDPLVELAPQDSGLEAHALFATNTALESLVQTALTSRPEMRQSQALARAALETKKGAVYGPLVPSVTAQMFFGGFGGGPDNVPDRFGRADEYLVGVGWRIGPGGLLDFGRMNAAQARLNIAQLKSEKLRDDIARQVIESHTLVQSLSDQIETLKRNLASAAETLRLSRERKQFGVGAVLEDIQAQQELTRSRSDYLNAVAELSKAQFALGKAVGALPGLVKPLELRASPHRAGPQD